MKTNQQQLENFNFIEKKSNINNNLKLNKRNYGIDLARIISMILIINHHIIYHGGPFSIIDKFSIHYQILVFYNLICCSGVNVFGMISGCVCSFSYKFSNLFYLLFLTFFYNICIALIFYYFKPHLKIDIKYYLYPLFISDYWYFNAYFLMYYFLPIINKGLTEINKKTLKFSIINLFLIFSCFGEIKNYNKRFYFNDIFVLKRGFSYIWLLILYLYGSYLGRFRINNIINRNLYYYLKFVIILVLAAFIRMKIVIYKLIYSENKFNIIIDYCAPSEVIISFSIILICSNINIKNTYLIKIISFFAPLTYGVYLIHNHLLVRIHIIRSHFIWLTKLKIYQFFIIEILYSFLIFLFCSLLDFLRLLIFKFFKIKQIIIIIIKFITNITDKICLFEIF